MGPTLHPTPYTKKKGTETRGPSPEVLPQHGLYSPQVPWALLRQTQLCDFTGTLGLLSLPERSRMRASHIQSPIWASPDMGWGL